MTWGRRLRRGCWELRLLLRPVDPNLEKDKEIKRQLDQYTVQYCTIYSEFTVQLSMQASQYMHFILRTWQKKAWSCSVEWYRQIQLKWANSKSQTSSALLRMCQVTSSKPKSFCTITDLLTVTETPFRPSAALLWTCYSGVTVCQLMTQTVTQCCHHVVKPESTAFNFIISFHTLHTKQIPNKEPQDSQTTEQFGLCLCSMSFVLCPSPHLQPVTADDRPSLSLVLLDVSSC